MDHTVLAYFKPEHRREPARAHTPDELNVLLDRLLVESFEYSLAKMYVSESSDDDRTGGELSVGVDPDRRVGSLRYRDSERTWYSQGADSTYRELVYLYLGRELDYPHDSEISLKQLRKALGEFLDSGGERPACVAWQPAPTS
ncbi:MAG: Imm1 family immunity protein [Stackebrandtia sp.]